MLRAVALSKTKGLGIAEAQLKVFQPFFVTVDLPYSAIRGEEFPVKVALYNYPDQRRGRSRSSSRRPTGSTWSDAASSTVTVGAGDVARRRFTIRPTGLGTNKLKVTARSTRPPTPSSRS